MKKNLICIAVAVMIAAASCGYILAARKNTSNDEMYAYVYVDGAVYKTIDLNNVNEPYSFVVGDLNGDYNVVEVRHKSIGVTEASCPDEVCVNTGFISSPLLPIVCLPNKLVIEIHSNSSLDNSVDAVTQ